MNTLPTFQLTIELGNDAMQTPADVAAALRDVAETVESCRLMGKIRDANGQKVGLWEFS